MDRLKFDYMGINHTRDVLDGNAVEQARFEADIRKKYVDIEAGEHQRHTPIEGISAEPSAEQFTPRKRTR